MSVRVNGRCRKWCANDPGVPTFSCIVEADTADGLTVVQDQPVTAADYVHDRAGVSRLVRRIGVEQNVPMAVFDRMESFVDRLPQSSIDDVLAAFASIEGPRPSVRGGPPHGQCQG